MRRTFKNPPTHPHTHTHARARTHTHSNDFVSDALKKKKHWNSFTTEFFVQAETMVMWLEQHGDAASDGPVESLHPQRDGAWKKLENQDLRFSGTSFPNMPKLKAHLRKQVL